MAYALLIAQTVVLVAGLSLVAQFLVGAFSWSRRRQNIVYRLFEVIASPVVKMVRWVTPKIVLDQHIPLAAFMLLFIAYFWLGFEHRAACQANLNQAGCQKWAEAWNREAPKQ
jgi:uncharacterized protein YggT (Ycf19 family)